MIDPLLNIAMPQPGQSSVPQDAAPGTPSFLPWMQPGQGEADPQPGTPPVPRQNAVPGSVPQTGFAPGLIDPRHVAEDRVPDPVVGDPFVVPASFGPGQGHAQDVTSGQATGPVSMPDAQPGYVGRVSPLFDSTGMVLDATRWRDFAAATLELHVRNPQGEREVVAMPWRLMASGHLAHADAMAGMPGQLPATSGVAAVPGVPMRGTDSPYRLSAPVYPAQLPVYDSNGILVGAVQSQTSNRARNDLAPLHAMSSHAPAAAEWLARWMKWIERDGRDTVVWLRDFSIDEDQAPRVADDLRRFAQSQGVSLERIVVNGRELWRNPQLHVASKSKE